MLYEVITERDLHHMNKVNWKPGNLIYPLPAALVSCRSKTLGDNLITIAWTGTICTNPPMCYISVRPERFSYDIIKESMEFVINLRITSYNVCYTKVLRKFRFNKHKNNLGFSYRSNRLQSIQI